VYEDKIKRIHHLKTFNHQLTMFELSQTTLNTWCRLWDWFHYKPFTSHNAAADKF